jgi:hypothetical protein
MQVPFPTPTPGGGYDQYGPGQGGYGPQYNQYGPGQYSGNWNSAPAQGPTGPSGYGQSSYGGGGQSSGGWNSSYYG